MLYPEVSRCIQTKETPSLAQVFPTGKNSILVSKAHANAKIAKVLFLQDQSIASALERLVEEDKVQRKSEVISNRNVMKWDSFTWETRTSF